MKKLLAAISLCAVLVLAGCSGGGNIPKPTNPTATTPTSVIDQMNTKLSAIQGQMAALQAQMLDLKNEMMGLQAQVAALK